MVYNRIMKKRYIWLIEIIFWLLLIFCSLSLFVYNTAVKANSQNSYYIFLSDAGGLVKGSPVKLMGIRIGYVKDIKIFDNKVFISILVSKKNVKIPKNAEASVEFYGLGGSSSLELAPINGAAEPEKTSPDSKVYKVQDFWDGMKLTSSTMINIYGSIGRNIDKSGILQNKQILYQSGMLKELIEKTNQINHTQIVIINKLEADKPASSAAAKEEDAR